MNRWLVVFLVLVALPACAAEDASSGFYRQPVVDRMHTFRSHPIDDQLALFFYGNQKIHPPAQYLADCFALNGADGVALLRTRLGTEGSDLDTRDMAALLQAIQSMGTYDVRHDQPLMDRLKGRIAVMHDPGWKDTATTLLTRIETVMPQRPNDISQCEARR